MRFGTLIIAAFAVLTGLAPGNPAAAETTLRVGNAVAVAFSFTPLDTLQRSFVEMDLLPTAPDMSNLYTAQFLPGQVSQ